MQSNYSLPSDGVREDGNVRKLATDLKDIDQVMVAILSPDKYRYLFEGLGHLVATIFIASAQNMKTINNNGIKKMLVCNSLLQFFVWFVIWWNVTLCYWPPVGLGTYNCSSLASQRSLSLERKTWTGQEDILSCCI